MNGRWWKIWYWLRPVRVAMVIVAIIAAVVAWTKAFLWLGGQIDAWMINFPPSGDPICDAPIALLVLVGGVIWTVITFAPAAAIVFWIGKTIVDEIDEKRKR